MTEVQAVEKSPPNDSRTRTCVGCGEQVAREEPGDLVRLVLGPDGEIAVDARSGGFGRGAYVHARRPCLDRAVKGGLARSARGKVDRIAGPDDGPASPLRVESLALAIQAAMDRRIEGLLVAAVRSRQLARGADAVTGACHRGEAELVLVARDAAAAADLTAVRRAVAEGRGVAWGSKEQLAQILDPAGRPSAPRDAAPQGGGPGAGVAVVALSSGRIAGALRGAARTAAVCAEIACAPASEGGQRRPGKKRQAAGPSPEGTATRSSH